MPMSRTRLFIPTNLRPDTELRLDAGQTRYIGKVLRLRSGDALSVFNGEQGEFEATVITIGRDAAVLETGSRVEALVESPLRLHLVQGVSRGERMDLVVQKATELGVKRISPVLTAHGVVRLDEARAEKRRQHWQKIAESACEQSGRIRPPRIDSPVPLRHWFGRRTPQADTDVVLHPRAETPFTSLEPPATKLCLLIGPEGGLSDAELADAGVAGFLPVALGPRILRTETAALAALAIAQARWGDLGCSEC
jgi:16S rRNA (uracil1498-N3)-methyltransferase